MHPSSFGWDTLICPTIIGPINHLSYCARISPKCAAVVKKSTFFLKIYNSFWLFIEKVMEGKMVLKQYNGQDKC